MLVLLLLLFLPHLAFASEQVFNDSCVEQSCRITCYMVSVCLSDGGLTLYNSTESDQVQESRFNLTSGEVLRIAAVNVSKLKSVVYPY